MTKLIAKRTAAAGFVPTDSAGCTLWLRADGIGGLSDGDPVSTWPDDAGSNDATGVTTTRPTYQTGEINGKPIVRFDGGDDFLTLTSTLSNSAAYTLFVVYKKRTTAVKLPTLGNSGSSFLYSWYDFSDDNLYIFAEGNIYYTAAAGFTSYKYITEVEGGSGIAALTWVNGTTLTLSAGSGTSTTLGYNQVGRRGTTEYADGDIAEIIYYDHAMTTTGRQTVEAYLAAKYGL